MRPVSDAASSMMRVEVLALFEIAGDGLELAAARRDELRHIRHGLRTEADNIGAVVGKCECNRLANARPCARHQSGPAGEVEQIHVSTSTHLAACRDRPDNFDSTVSHGIDLIDHIAARRSNDWG